MAGSQDALPAQPVSQTTSSSRTRRPRSAMRPGCAVLQALLLLFLFSNLLGCAAINRFVFAPKIGISATPAGSGIDYEEVWFQSRDGIYLNGWFIAGAPEAPLLLFFHGNAGNLSDNLDYIKLMHGAGYSIFIFDYRGYGNSEGEALQEKHLYQDARGALAYLAEKGWHHEELIFFGQSLGAAVALQMALESPPAGLVMESPFTCMKDMARHISPLAYYTVGWAINMPFDNMAKIATAGVPLLLIHGEKDRIAPMEMTMRLYEKAVPPKMLHIIKGGGHCEVFKADSSAYLAAWNRYLLTIPTRTAVGNGVRP